MNVFQYYTVITILQIHYYVPVDLKSLTFTVRTKIVPVNTSCFRLTNLMMFPVFSRYYYLIITAIDESVSSFFNNLESI